jgi:hypothetical protein
LTAYQTWAANANVNVSVVNDGGQAFGAPGVPQGDSRFGDLRVGMAALADTALANTAPFTWAGSTWAGDTLLNSAFKFGVNGNGGPYDLTTVMLHEAGLAFGLQDGTTDPSSVMYNLYQGVRTALTADDIADLQSLYGTRTPDAYQGTAGDNSFATAYNFQSLPASGVTFQADLGRFGEAEYYKFNAPIGTTSLTVDLTTTRLSSLLANVTIFNANHQVIGSAAAINPMNGNLSITVPGSLLGATDYIEVTGANSSVFSIGSYQLSLGAFSLLGVSLPQSTYTAPISLSNPGTVLTAALSLPPKWTAPSNLAFNYTAYAQIHNPKQQHWFKVDAPPASSYGNAPLVMVAEAWGTDSNTPLYPKIEIWSDGPGSQLLSTQVLTNDDGVFTVQLPNVAPGSSFRIKVESQGLTGSDSTGTYFLGANFHAEPPVALAQLASAILTPAAPQQFMQFTLNQNELWHFNLSAANGGVTAAEEVQMQIYDQSGNRLFNLISYAGQPPETECVYLLAGTYTIRFVAVADQPSDLASLSFALTGENLSYPMGAMRTDTNTYGGPSPTYYSSSTTTNPSGGTYYPPVYS